MLDIIALYYYYTVLSYQFRHKEVRCMENLKILTIRLAADLWKGLMLLKVDGKIKSIQDIAVKELRRVVREAKSGADDHISRNSD